jgi:hypothetical protein
MLVRRSFSLDSERDAVLISWLDEQDNVSEAVRAALRAYCDESPITLGDIYRSLQNLTTHIGGARANAERDDESICVGLQSEDPELATNLDQLGL